VSHAFLHVPMLLGHSFPTLNTQYVKTNLWISYRYTITIPPNLKPGNYLLRTEVIMIQADPAQFYPECAQLQVLGEGTAFPNEEDLVAFPGAYNSSGKFDCLFKVREKMLT
jgi:hypothetical protein